MKYGLEIATKALALCAGAVLFGSAAWAKDEPLALKQSDKWIANFDAESCQLITAFGEGDAKVLIRISQYRPGDTFSLDLYGKFFNNYEARTNIRYMFGPNGAFREVSAKNATVNKMPMVMLGSSDFLNRDWKKDTTSPPITEEQEAAVRWLDVEISRRKPLRLQVGAMARPMRVMRACLADLVRGWGVDPDEMLHWTRGVIPRGNPANWVTSNDYPTGMLRIGGSGIVSFRLNVDELGAATGCHILQRTNPDGFADVTCKLLMKRATFDPALDKSGKPVKSFYFNSVYWVAPQ